MAFKFKNLTNNTVLISGSRNARVLELPPERDWGKPPFPLKLSYTEDLQIHHPGDGVVVDVLVRKIAHVENLPDREAFTFFIVERDVAEAVPHRSDFVYIARVTTINGANFVEAFATAVLGGTPVNIP